MQPVVLNAEIRPVRIDADNLQAARWIYKRHIIGLHYEDNLFWVCIYLTDSKRRPTGHPRVSWAVFHYQSRDHIAEHVNKLLQAACACISKMKFVTSYKKPYNSDYAFLQFVEEVNTGRIRYKLKIQPFELTSIMEHSKCQVT